MPIERPRAGELREALNFLGEVYAFQNLDAFTAHVNARLPDLVDCDIIGYNEINVARQRVNYVVEPASALFPGARQALADHMHEHPIIRRYQTTNRPEVLKLSDFLTLPELRCLGLYQEFFRRLNVDHVIVAPLPFRPPRQFGFALCRRGRDFSERERMLLALVAPHLAQAYRNAESASRLADTRKLLNDALETMERGTITVGRDNRVRDMSEQARKWIDKYWGVQRPGSKDLPNQLCRWLIEQDDGMVASAGQLPQPRTPLVVERDDSRLIVRAYSSIGHRLVVLEEQHIWKSAAALARFGLSRRETQILAWVSEGKTNAEIAGLLAIGARTVGKHLEHVFVKLGVETRTAAARVALTAIGA
jgi:DNA-binding CsgD family transcriptional regulator